MNVVDDEMKSAFRDLAAPGISIERSVGLVPAKPGLYAVHGLAPVWRQLGLGDPPDDRPLYVGKAERSLASRDVKTHFGTGKTGSSTLRRTLAALLATELNLVACPRNLDRPSHFANFGLEPDGDARLTKWMTTSLCLATWAPDRDLVLDRIETDVLTLLEPPLNMAKCVTPWRSRVKAARQRMADRAREWSPA